MIIRPQHSFWLLTIALSGCSDGGDTDGGSADVVTFTVKSSLASKESDAAAATVGIVKWSLDGTDDVTDAWIEYGLDKDYGMSARVDLSAKNNRTVLLGMKPKRTYHYRVVALDSRKQYTSDDYTLKTGQATDRVKVRDFEEFDEDKREHGFMIGSFYAGDSGSTVFILDADGDVVWSYETKFDGIASAKMSEDGANMWMAVPNAGLLARVSMDGLDYEEYEVGASRDITPVSGETMGFLDSSGDCDASISEITPDGDVEKVFDGSEHIDGKCSGNALRYSKSLAAYTLSDMSSDIYVVTRDGELSWKLTDYVGENTTWGGRQHGHQLIGLDRILFFANDASAETSAVFEFKFETSNLVAKALPYYTEHMGDVQVLPGGNTWVTYSDANSYVHELDDKGEVVLQIDLTSDDDADEPNALGYTTWRRSLYGAPDDM